MKNEKIIGLLNQLIKYRSNDLLMDIEEEDVPKDVERHITNLIIGVTRYLHDIRYCSDSQCSCAPEHEIKYHYESIKDYLQRTKYALHPIPHWVIDEILTGGLTNESR